MTSEGLEPTSLRERKKLAAREALSWAAVRLATERGVENVRVEDIAAEVGVSARTFSNYFSSKEEAICSIGLNRQERVRAVLLARPADEPLWKAVTHAVMEQYPGVAEPNRDQVTRVRLMVRNAGLRGEYLKAHAAVERVLAEAIAERLGTNADDDLYSRLVAAAVTSTVRVATDHWLKFDQSAPFVPTLTMALEQLAAGLPVPERHQRIPTTVD